MTRDRHGDEQTASIDDLLRHDHDDHDEQPPARPAPGRSVPTWVVRTVLTAAALTALVMFGLLLIGVRTATAPVFAGFLAVVLLRQALRQVAAPPPPTARQRRTPGLIIDEGRYDWRGHDALRTAVRRWEARLDAAHNDPGRFSRTVLPVLAELADERLRQRHGLTRAADPRRARELLGEPLWRLLTEPGARPPRQREWAAYVETLEKL